MKAEIHKWLFIGTNVDDDEFYLGKNGLEDHYESAFFIGTKQQAKEEGDKRGNEWEDFTGDLITKVTIESH